MDIYYRLWRCTPVITALRRLRQEDHKFWTSLTYTVRLCPKKKKSPSFLSQAQPYGWITDFVE
jgi:hypothetical protein